jgi:hypothetical protein
MIAADGLVRLDVVGPVRSPEQSDRRERGKVGTVSAVEARSAQCRWRLPPQFVPQHARPLPTVFRWRSTAQANPEYSPIVDNKLCLFGKPSRPDLFREHLAAHIAEAKRNQPLAAGR